MKKITLSVLVCIFTLISCSKDENTTSDKYNKVEYDGTNFKLGNTGTLIYYSDGYVQLDLYSSSIAWDDDLNSFSGIGDFFWFLFYLPGADGIIEGKYEFNSEFEEGAIIIGNNIDYYYDTDTDYSEIVSGYVELKYNDVKDIYTIEFKVDVENGKSVDGSFTGIIQNIDLTKK